MADDEALIKRIMPHNQEAELSVLGAMLMDAEAIDVAGEILTGEDFYSTANGVVFEAMKDLRAAGKPVDTVTLSNALKEKGAPEELTGIDFIRNILEAVPTSANVKQYAQIVHDRAISRRLISVAEDITTRCYMGKEPLEDILEKTEKDIFRIVQSGNSSEYVPISEVVMNVLRKIEEASKTKNYVTGLSTGFVDLDRMTTGFQKSDFILIAARPSMGKTAFALSLARHAAFRKNAGVVIFSLEMSKEQLVNRLLSMESRIDAQKIRTGDLNDSEWENIMEGSEIIGKSKLIIDDTPGISVTEMRTKCRKYKMEYDIQLVVVDYLQLMSSGKRVESRQNEVSDISKALKSLAREIEVPIVVLSQLNRGPEARKDNHRPMMSDIRESGSIEQDADVILMLYREDYYDKETERKNIAEVIIAKQRNGPVGTIDLLWQPQYTRFMSIDKTR